MPLPSGNSVFGPWGSLSTVPVKPPQPCFREFTRFCSNVCFEEAYTASTSCDARLCDSGFNEQHSCGFVFVFQGHADCTGRPHGQMFDYLWRDIPFQGLLVNLFGIALERFETIIPDFADISLILGIKLTVDAAQPLTGGSSDQWNEPFLGEVIGIDCGPDMMLVPRTDFPVHFVGAFIEGFLRRAQHRLQCLRRLFRGPGLFQTIRVPDGENFACDTDDSQYHCTDDTRFSRRTYWA